MTADMLDTHSGDGNDDEPPVIKTAHGGFEPDPEDTREQQKLEAKRRHPAGKFIFDGGEVGDEPITIETHEPKCTRINNPAEVDLTSWNRARNAAIGWTCMQGK